MLGELRVRGGRPARRGAHRRGRPERGVHRRALRPGRDRQGVRHPGAADRAGARAGPLPRRAGPAHRAGRVLHGDRAGPRRGADGAHGPAARVRCCGIPPSATRSCAPTWSGAPWPSARGTASASSAPGTRPTPGRLREFAARNRLPHRFVDLESDADGRVAAARPSASRPTRRRSWSGGTRCCATPTPPNWPRLIGLRARPTAAELNDLVVDRRRTGRAGGRRLRRVRGPAHRGPRRRGHRRPGGADVAHRELPRLSGRDLRGPSWPSGPCCRPTSSGPPAARPAEAVALDERDGHHVLRLADGGDTLTTRTVVIATGARVPPAARARAGGVRADERLLRGHPGRGAAVRERPGGGGRRRATRPARPRCSSPTTPREVQLVVREHSLDEIMSRYLADRIRTIRGSRCTCTPRCASWTVSTGSCEAVVVQDTDDGERPRCPRAS